MYFGLVAEIGLILPLSRGKEDDNNTKTREGESVISARGAGPLARSVGTSRT